MKYIVLLETVEDIYKKVFLFGCKTGLGGTNNILCYNINTNKWKLSVIVRIYLHIVIIIKVKIL